SAKLREDQGCEIRVSDRGQGIPDYIRDSVFEPFVTTSESLDGGTGLGLAIVKKIIEVHEGSIDFETSSQGTTFLIKLKN
ncbi:MAG: sensor histidine kinase, partial [Bdellovibrionales bacterium]|nr:sensor histidine kinase [Bdellovibrionales bacterium]